MDQNDKVENEELSDSSGDSEYDPSAIFEFGSDEEYNEDYDKWIAPMLQEYLKPTSSTTPEEAAREFVARIPKGPGMGFSTGAAAQSEFGFIADSLEAHTYGFADEIWSAALDLPHEGEQMDKLVALVDGFKKVPREPRVRAWNPAKFWPKFALELIMLSNDYLTHIHGGFATDEETVKHALSSHTFQTRIMRDHPRELSNGLYAMAIMRRTLEEDNVNNEFASNESLGWMVRVAAIWIVNCRDFYVSRFPGNADKLKRRPSFRRWTGRGELYHGAIGFSQERWNFWKQRFLDLSTILESEEAKQAAIDAAARM